MQLIHRVLSRMGAFALMLCIAAFMAVPAFAQATDPGGLGAGAVAAATNGVTLGAAVALVILAAVIVYRLIKRFSS